MTDEEARIACAVLTAPNAGHAALAYLCGCDDAHPSSPQLWQRFLSGALPPPPPERPTLRLRRFHAAWQEVRRFADGADAAATMRRVRDLGARLVFVFDDDYPARLRTIPHRPPVLFVRGPAPLDPSHAVAVVGTRRASAYGVHLATQLAGDLAAGGIAVISGLARGIDAAAHRAALDVGGATLAVLGTGLDVCFPVENRRLWQRIGETGALITEYCPGVEGRPQHFPARNRIVSGLAAGVVVVEAPLKSGALVTAKLALEQNREVCAVPGDVTAPGSAGPHSLLRHGAALVETAADVAEACRLAWSPGGAPVELSEPLPAVLSAHLTVRPRSVDDLARAAQMPAPVLSALLERLALLGVVKRDGAGRYAVAQSPRRHG